MPRAKNRKGHEQNEKFSVVERTFKSRAKITRLELGWSMNQAAAALSRTKKKLFGDDADPISRKQLEDLETIRNYGCFISLDHVKMFALTYKVSMAYLIGEE